MRKIFFTFYLAFTLPSLMLFAQNYQSRNHLVRLRFNVESVNKMQQNTDMGLFGVATDLYIFPKIPNLSLGFQSYAAVTGLNGGFFAFGLTSSWRTPIIKKSLFLEIGGAVCAGGDGKKAKDGGLLLGSRIELEKKIGLLGIRAGVANLNFIPSYNSTHFTLGFTVNPSFLFENRKKLIIGDTTNSQLNNKKTFIKDKILFSVIGKAMFFNNVFAGNFTQNIEAGLIGVQCDYFFNPYIYGSSELNGAFYGGIDGYMSFLFGAGVLSPRVGNFLSLEARFLMGAGGGSGKTQVGGGAIMQPEIGLNAKLFKNTCFKVMAGKTWAPNGNMDATSFTVGLGKILYPLRSKSTEPNFSSFSLDTTAYKPAKLAIFAFNRLYITNATGKSKRNEDYDKYFSLIGLGVKKYITDWFSINGATAWTYQGSYAGYGEGWITGTLNYTPFKKHPKFSLESDLGVGVAGGILNLGSGFITKYSVGGRLNVSQNSSIFVLAGEMIPIKGNFRTYCIDIGGQIKFDAIFGK